MRTPSAVVVVLAYGPARYRDQARLLLLTLQAAAQEPLPEVRVYTDAPEDFRALPGLTLERVTPERLEAWVGQAGFRHLAKVRLLEEVFAHGYTKVLFLDTDLLVHSDVAELLACITPTQVVFERCEGRLNERRDLLAKKLYHGFRTQPVNWRGQQEFLPTDIPVYNSGVLGLHRAHAALLPEVATFTEAVYRKFRKHNLGQLGYSYTLQRNGIRFTTAESAVTHYWSAGEKGTGTVAEFWARFGNSPRATQLQAAAQLKISTEKPPLAWPKRFEETLRSRLLDVLRWFHPRGAR